MPLDIGIGDGESICPMRNEILVSLGDDGYYWFLHPTFEKIAKATGQRIDLYGDAVFAENDLTVLEELLEHESRLIASRPDHWEVPIGNVLVPHQKATRERPHLKPIVAAVNKSDFVHLLMKWKQVIARARELNRPVVCRGD